MIQNRKYDDLKGYNIMSSVCILLKGMRYRTYKKKKRSDLRRKIERISDPQLDDIVFELCNIFNVSFSDVVGYSQKREFVIVRQIFCYVARVQSNGSICHRRIAAVIAREHSTCIRNISQVQDWIKRRDNFFSPYWERYLEGTKIYNKEEQSTTILKNLKYRNGN